MEQIRQAGFFCFGSWIVVLGCSYKSISNKLFMRKIIFLALVLILFGCVSKEELNKAVNDKNAMEKKYEELQKDHNNLKSLYQNLTSDYEVILEKLRNFQSSGRLPKDIPSSPVIANLDFLLSRDSLILKQSKLNLSSVTDTKSMHPTITAEHTAVFTTNFDPERLQVGNIIAYRSTSFDLPIMHRIIEIQRDSSA